MMTKSPLRSQKKDKSFITIECPDCTNMDFKLESPIDIKKKEESSIFVSDSHRLCKTKRDKLLSTLSPCNTKPQLESTVVKVTASNFEFEQELKIRKLGIKNRSNSPSFSDTLSLVKVSDGSFTG